MWNIERTAFNRDIHYTMNTYNQSFQEIPLSDIHVPYTSGDGDEWSNGPDNGYKIIKRVDAGGKAIGICTRWEVFYFMMKNKDDQSYNNFLYLSTDGISKHDWHVEVIGIDLV
jgi:hypothetical protein